MSLKDMNYTPHTDLVSSLILFGVLQALSMAMILFMNRGKAGNPEFAALMVVLAVIELESFLNYSGYIIYFPHVINVSPPLILIVGPFSFLYIKRLRGEIVKRNNAAIHFIPAFGYFTYSLLFFLQPADFKVNAVLRGFHPEAVLEKMLPSFEIDPLNIQGIVVVEGLALHMLGYSIASLMSLSLRKKAVKEVNKNDLWPLFWMFSMLMGSLVFLLTGGVVNGIVIYQRVLPAYFIDLFSVVLVYATTIIYVSQTITQKMSVDKYSKSGLSREFLIAKLLHLREIMESKKPYKSPRFSLSELARLSDLSPHHISQAINSCAGMTFNEFINQYRVEEAKKALRSPGGDSIKVEMLAYELGYKSKSAFFSSFKRYTDTTPARFRELVEKT